MAVVLSKVKEKSKQKMRELKQKGILPTRYASIIMKRYPHFTLNKIHGVANGRFYNAEVMDAILELAAESKEEERLKRIEELLED